VIAENLSKGKLNGAEESEAASAYLRWLAPTYKAAQQLTVQLSESFQLSTFTLAEKESQLKAAQENSAQLAETVREGLSSLAEKESQLRAAQENSSQLADQLKFAQERSTQLAETVDDGLTRLAEKESQVEKITSSFGWRLINRYGPIKHRFLLPAYRNISRLFKSNSRTGSKLL